MYLDNIKRFTKKIHRVICNGAVASVFCWMYTSYTSSHGDENAVVRQTLLHNVH